MDQAQFQRLLASLGAVFRLALAYRLNPWPRMSKTSRRKLRHRNWPDRLSGWTLPPPIARVGGEVEPVRVFESAEAAMAFLARVPPQNRSPSAVRRSITADKWRMLFPVFLHRLLTAGQLPDLRSSVSHRWPLGCMSVPVDQRQRYQRRSGHLAPEKVTSSFSSALLLLFSTKRKRRSTSDGCASKSH